MVVVVVVVRVVFVVLVAVVVVLDPIQNVSQSKVMCIAFHSPLKTKLRKMLTNLPQGLSHLSIPKYTWICEMCSASSVTVSLCRELSSDGGEEEF